MRVGRTGSTVLGTALVAALLAAPAAPAAAQTVRQSVIVPTKQGDIFVEVAKPSENFKGPVILTYSPYSAANAAADGNRTGDAARWNEKGYIRVVADVVGTGNSGGCYDYGGTREKQSAHVLIEWIAKQKWSNGKIGMIGGAYDGATATGAAVTRPPHLTTIVPEAAVSSWYHYAYSGGIRYLYNNEVVSHQGASALDDEGFHAPVAFDFGLALPPPLDVQDPSWAERVQSTITPCDEIEHTQRGYDDTPDYDAFWRQRDYVKDAHKIDIPVLVAHNWGDWNVKPDHAVDLYRALRNSPNRKLFMGSRWDDHGTPTGKYAQTVDAWFAHYLKGVDNGISRMPDVTSQTATYDGPGGWSSGKWPKVRNVELIVQQFPPSEIGDYEWLALPHDPIFFPGQEPTAKRFPAFGVNTESHANHHGRSNHEWAWFESPLFRRDARIFGEVKVQVYSTVYRRWITFTPSIVDVDPDVHRQVGNMHVSTDPKGVVGVTRGWLDSRYRKSLSKQVEVEPGKPFMSTIVTKPQDYTFKKGHYIGLNIQTEINEWSVPKAYPGCEQIPDPTGNQDNCVYVRVNWEEAKTRLILPIVDAPRNLFKLFKLGHGHD
ncbi:MAG: CocE/NonD family hydrolase [Actinomycetota bacterium]